MNSKFETWCVDRGRTPVREDHKIWQAAIQSLEVTPELEEVANKASDEYWEYVRREDAVFCTEDEIRAILDAVLSALKEQAK